MNALGIVLIWCVVQVTLACVAGAVVYLIARRTGWAAGRMAVIASLAMVFLLSVAALSPWPSWISSGGLSDGVDVVVDGEAGGGAAEKNLVQADADAAVAEFIVKPDTSGPLNLAFWRDVWAEMQRAKATANTQVVPANHAWRWPAIVAAIFLAAAAIGILRLLIAWFAVRQLDEKSIRIDDSRLTELAATISRDLSLSAPFVLKESSELQTAATFGWRRPVILLPAAWRDWPEEELRAVLAHEMAHIRSGDFLTWLGAQFIVATHFYHPLVHWLAGQLRLEQELAADATAAQFAGGRETYLQSLATLTLRADHLRPSWATQTFLPTRSMFVRRIEMLKRTKAMSSERPSGKVRLAVVGTLVAIGVFAVGLRAPGPIGATPVVAAEAVAEKPVAVEQTASDGYDFSYVPEKFIGFIAVRRADMAKSECFAPLAKILSEHILLSIPSEALQQTTFVMPISQLNEKGQILPSSGTEFTNFRTNRAIDFKKTVEARYGPVKTERHKDQEYWPCGPKLGGIAFHSPDEKTLLRRLRPALHEVMDNPEAAKPPAQTADWQAEASGPIFSVFDVKTFRELQGGKLPGGFVFQTFAPIFNDTDQIIATVSDQEEPELMIRIECTSPEQVPVVEQTVRSALVLLKNIVATQRKALKDQREGFIPENVISANKEVYSLASTVIEKAKITREGRYLRLTASLGNVQTIFQSIIQSMQADRMNTQARRKSQESIPSQMNLAHISLAFNAYYTEHGHFPPAVLYDKKTKTPYSWRVAVLPYLVLPYLDVQSLYGLYHFDEPWDSEHNLQIANTVVPTFCSPTDPGSTDAAYFALVGPATVFAGKNGVKRQQITDGTKDTLLLVEAKRGIPWTKPEDIPYSADKPLPKLGGFYKGGFSTVTCGRRRFFPA